jgi:hypothetical protein
VSTPHAFAACITQPLLGADSIDEGDVRLQGRADRDVVGDQSTEALSPLWSVVAPQ